MNWLAVFTLGMGSFLVAYSFSTPGSQVIAALIGGALIGYGIYQLGGES